MPAATLQIMSFLSTGSNGSYSIFSNSSDSLGSSIAHPAITGGFMPRKKNQDIANPIQIMKPNRQST